MPLQLLTKDFYYVGALKRNLRQFERFDSSLPVLSGFDSVRMPHTSEIDIAEIVKLLSDCAKKLNFSIRTLDRYAKRLYIKDVTGVNVNPSIPMGMSKYIYMAAFIRKFIHSKFNMIDVSEWFNEVNERVFYGLVRSNQQVKFTVQQLLQYDREYIGPAFSPTKESITENEAYHCAVFVSSFLSLMTSIFKASPIEKTAVALAVFAFNYIKSYLCLFVTDKELDDEIKLATASVSETITDEELADSISAITFKNSSSIIYATPVDLPEYLGFTFDTNSHLDQNFLINQFKSAQKYKLLRELKKYSMGHISDVTCVAFMRGDRSKPTLLDEVMKLGYLTDTLPERIVALFSQIAIPLMEESFKISVRFNALREYIKYELVDSFVEGNLRGNINLFKLINAIGLPEVGKDPNGASFSIDKGYLKINGTAKAIKEKKLAYLKDQDGLAEAVLKFVDSYYHTTDLSDIGGIRFSRYSVKGEDRIYRAWFEPKKQDEVIAYTVEKEDIAGVSQYNEIESRGRIVPRTEFENGVATNYYRSNFFVSGTGTSVDDVSGMLYTNDLYDYLYKNRSFANTYLSINRDVDDNFFELKLFKTYKYLIPGLIGPAVPSFGTPNKTFGDSNSALSRVEVMSREEFESKPSICKLFLMIDPTVLSSNLDSPAVNMAIVGRLGRCGEIGEDGQISGSVLGTIEKGNQFSELVYESGPAEISKGAFRNLGIILNEAGGISGIDSDIGMLADSIHVILPAAFKNVVLGNCTQSLKRIFTLPGKLSLTLTFPAVLLDPMYVDRLRVNGELNSNSHRYCDGKESWVVKLNEKDSTFEVTYNLGLENFDVKSLRSSKIRTIDPDSDLEVYGRYPEFPSLNTAVWNKLLFVSQNGTLISFDDLTDVDFQINYGQPRYVNVIRYIEYLATNLIKSVYTSMDVEFNGVPVNLVDADQIHESITSALSWLAKMFNSSQITLADLKSVGVESIEKLAEKWKAIVSDNVNSSYKKKLSDFVSKFDVIDYKVTSKNNILPIKMLKHNVTKFTQSLLEGAPMPYHLPDVFDNIDIGSVPVRAEPFVSAGAFENLKNAVRAIVFSDANKEENK